MITTRDRLVAVVLPILGVGLVIATWAAVRLSAWVVTHDHVWIEMRRTGGDLECAIAEVVYGLSFFRIVCVEAVLVVGILAFHYYSLTRRSISER